MIFKTVTVIIPAYNEEEIIADTVSSAQLIPGIVQVLVIDDGSGDRTAETAEKSGAEVVVLNQNVGKGGALNYSANYLRGDLVVILDADLGKSASKATALVGPVLTGEADMAIAVFPGSNKKGGFGLAKKLAGSGITYFTGMLLDAPLSGQRAMHRRVFLESLPLAGGYGVEVHLTVKARMKGYRIIEVPVNMFHKETGRNIKGFIHRGKQFYHVARTLMLLKYLEYGNI